MLSVASLVAAGIGPTQARLFLEPLATVCSLYEINTPQREAAFVSQCAHESGMFVHLEEDLYYRDPYRLMKLFRSSITSLVQAKSLVGNPKGLANTIYSNRMGNGNYLSGDGWKYRGRGLIQLTGRNNYSAAARTLRKDYIDQPDLVASPIDACLTAGWLWQMRKCNAMADSSNIDGITRTINGDGMAGAPERQALYAQALQCFL